MHACVPSYRSLLCVHVCLYIFYSPTPLLHDFACFSLSVTWLHFLSFTCVRHSCMSNSRWGKETVRPGDRRHNFYPFSQTIFTHLSHSLISFPLSTIFSFARRGECMYLFSCPPPLAFLVVREKISIFVTYAVRDNVSCVDIMMNTLSDERDKECYSFLPSCVFQKHPPSQHVNERFLENTFRERRGKHFSRWGVIAVSHTSMCRKCFPGRWDVTLFSLSEVRWYI